ncbi:hypothetical protein [Mesorhizobium sp. NZP2298]|uniref:hypothetical protein n=1 Tax=Mesorhizobium sp. NZP2298 TaxID=2483403 RepID=UPI001FF04F9C|nr:hypothetical protein [Mesorhizobium sp. NZP2298]
MTTAFPHCEPGTPINAGGEEQSYWMLPADGAVFNYSGHPALSMLYGQEVTACRSACNWSANAGRNRGCLA